MTISADELRMVVGRPEAWGWPGVDHTGTSAKFCLLPCRAIGFAEIAWLGSYRKPWSVASPW